MLQNDGVIEIFSKFIRNKVSMNFLMGSEFVAIKVNNRVIVFRCLKYCQPAFQNILQSEQAPPL